MIRTLLRLAAATGGLWALAGCIDRVPRPIYTPCAAISSQNWRAWIQQTSVPVSYSSRPRVRPWLIVSGDVTVPTGGYALALERGPVLALMPPTQQVILRTTPPAEAATQAIVTRRVQGLFPVGEGLGAVSVRCGDGTIAEIATITPAPEVPSSNEVQNHPE